MQRPEPSAKVVMRLVTEAEWQVLLGRIAELEERLTEPHAAEWLSEAEAVKLLRRSKQWLWHQRTIGRLEYSKVGRGVYYRRRAIEAQLESGRVGALR